MFDFKIGHGSLLLRQTINKRITMTKLEKENKNLKLGSIISTLVAAASIACFCIAANSSNKNSDALRAEQYDHAETISMWKVSTDLAREFQAKNVELLAQKSDGKVIDILKEKDAGKSEKISTFNNRNLMLVLADRRYVESGDKNAK